MPARSGKNDVVGVTAANTGSFMLGTLGLLLIGAGVGLLALVEAPRRAWDRVSGRRRRRARKARALGATAVLGMPPSTAACPSPTQKPRLPRGRRQPVVAQPAAPVMAQPAAAPGLGHQAPPGPRGARQPVPATHLARTRRMADWLLGR